MSNIEERQKELDDLNKIINKSLDRSITEGKARLEETFRNEVRLSKECANNGDPIMAWFHRNTAESIARYLETMK